MEGSNDNDDPFQPISLAARAVMERLFKEFYDPQTNAEDDERTGETGSDEPARANLKVRIGKR
jgi:hypothetical protein